MLRIAGREVPADRVVGRYFFLVALSPGGHGGLSAMPMRSWFGREQSNDGATGSENRKWMHGGDLRPT